MTSPAIAIDNLTKTFGRNRGVTDITLTVDPGQIFGFLGPNGAGKSTTIRCVLGLMRPTSGTAHALGQTPGDPRTLGRIGYLPGELNLPESLSGGDLLKRIASVRRLRDMTYRDELVERFGADLRRPLRTLSKGNKQKIGIAAAFMHKPDLLVMDEPTSGLDPLLQDEFATLLRDNADAGRTVFLSSHDLDEVQRLAERVAIIKDGRIVIDDTVDALRSQAPRTISLTFDHDFDIAALAAVPGVTISSHTSHSVLLTHTGNASTVLTEIAALRPSDITARPADLEDLFLGLYGRNDTKESTDAR